MNFNFVSNRIRNFLLSPKSEWQTIKSESDTKKIVLRKYAVPLILFMTICSMAGSIFFAGDVLGSRFWYMVIKAAGIFVFSYLGLYISALIINEVTVSFNVRKDLDTTFKLLIYSSTATFLVSALVLLWPPLQLLSVFGFYSLYLYWFGSTIILDIQKDDKLGFVVVSALIITGVYTILWLILEGILQTVFAISVFS